MGPYLRSWWIRAGLLCLVVGTGPLVSIMEAAGLRMTDDPNPNPIYFGMLAFLTFWPSLGRIFVGIWRMRKTCAAE